MASNLRKLDNAQRLQFWNNHVIQWQKSNLNQAEYCRQNNLNNQHFSKWKIKLTKERHTTSFVELQFKTENIKQPDNFELVVNNNYKLIIPAGFQPEQLKRIICTLGELA